MIDKNYTVKPSILKKFKPVPADKYQAQITDVNLLKAMNNFSGEEEELLNFEFTILDNKNFDYQEDGEKQIESTKGRRIWKRIRPSLSAASKRSKASWLYKLLCAVEKKELSLEQLSDIDPNTLVGQQVVIMVEVAGEWNNILSFAAAEKEMEAVPNAPERVKVEQETVEDVADKELDDLFKGEEKK